MVQKSLLVIGRHAKAPQKPEGGSIDTLIPGALTQVRDSVGKRVRGYVEEASIGQERAYLVHTDKVRTRYTGQAILIGGFSLEGELVVIEDLDRYDLRIIETREDLRFGVRKPCINMRVYRSLGSEANINYWIANPEAQVHDEEPIEPYNALTQRITQGMQEHAGRLLSGQKDLGVVVGHGPLVEVALVQLVNSGRTTPIERIGDIGGSFGMGEAAYLSIERTQGGLYSARVEIKGQEYKVDLQNL